MKAIAFCFFLLLSTLSFGQLHEEFTNNRNQWSVSKNKNAEKNLESGKFILDTYNEDWWNIETMPCQFFPSLDFTFEATFKQVSGFQDNGVGFYWGGISRVLKPYNQFLIALTGYYKLGTSSQGDWVKTDLINPLGKENRLKVVSKGGRITCYINGKQATSNSSMPSYGYLAGFINHTKMRVEIDDFDFHQDRPLINSVENMSTGLSKENMGINVNSIADDLGPKISADGKILYFGRENYDGNTGGLKDVEDVWYSTFDGAQWGRANRMDQPVNDSSANNLASVSADNNTLVFSGGSRFNFRKKTESGWSDLIDAGIYYTNESANQESHLSSDGKAMLFTVKNSKNLFYNSSIDEKDIYVSAQDKDGKWSEPVNLGSTINTPGDETSPFLSSDGKTLYFSSSGHPGYGGNDMFISKRMGDGWTQWSKPRNLGPEMNTPSFDAYYTIPASGDYAYVVNDHNSLGLSDIFRIKLPKEVKPDPVVLLSGRALNAKTGLPVSAEILLDNLETGKEVAEANSDPGSGQFKIVLQPGANYGIHAAAKGYLSVNKNIELASIHEYKEMQEDLLLMPIEVGLTLPLNNVFFEQGKPTLRKESNPELDRLVKIMTDNPRMQIELAGHTDNVGSGAALMKLSQDRVNVVKKYLESNSISATRITGKGYGATMPREKNDTEEHRKMNRRVEFKILKN